jgi:23S rRNA (pseudouridine1915-N3)-methyltransferase
MESWVDHAYQEYSKRLPHPCSLKLIEIPTEKRSKHSNIDKIMQREGERLLNAVPKDTHTITLDIKGHSWTTKVLAQQMDKWLQSGRDVACLVGGPDGISEECKAKVDESWSLSNLTLPHPLVRVVVAEQLYRAWTILNNHPYHR